MTDEPLCLPAQGGMAAHVVIDDAHVYPRRRPFKEDAEDALEQRPVGDAEIFDEDELFRRPQAGEDVVEQQAAGRKIAGVGAGKGGKIARLLQVGAVLFRTRIGGRRSRARHRIAFGAAEYLAVAPFGGGEEHPPVRHIIDDKAHHEEDEHHEHPHRLGGGALFGREDVERGDNAQHQRQHQVCPERLDEAQV